MPFLIRNTKKKKKLDQGHHIYVSTIYDLSCTQEKWISILFLFIDRINIIYLYRSFSSTNLKNTQHYPAWVFIGVPVLYYYNVKIFSNLKIRKIHFGMFDIVTE